MDATGQQGVGILLLWGAFAVFYAAAKQLSGTGGSVLYWATGNPRFGAPPPSSPSSGSSGGGGGGAPPLRRNAPNPANPAGPPTFPAPRR